MRVFEKAVGTTSRSGRLLLTEETTTLLENRRLLSSLGGREGGGENCWSEGERGDQGRGSSLRVLLDR